MTAFFPPFFHKRGFFIFVLLIITLLVIGMVFRSIIPEKSPQPIIETEEQSRLEAPSVSIIASDLEIPWGLAFLPSGDILFTERSGKVKLVDKNGAGGPVLVADISEVKHIGEGGLLGIAVHPDFEENKYVYLYYTYLSTKDNTLNRVARYKFENSKLIDEEVVVNAIPGAVNHNGGRIKFGPDNFLYISTGDAQNPSLAQNKDSLAGKILRVTNEGKPALGNPFDFARGEPFSNLVYSYGHRNPQGLAWDSQGRLWATEHGRSGVLSGLDELNLIEPGKNYGWPTIQGGEEKAGMETPRLHSGSDTWAPAGAAFSGESIFFGGLRGQALYKAIIKGDQIIFKEHLKGELGRIRDVILGPDGFLYITTSNRDGRGTPKDGDDKIIRINLDNL